MTHSPCQQGYTRALVNYVVHMLFAKVLGKVGKEEEDLEGYSR